MITLNIIKDVPKDVHPRAWKVGENPTVSRGLAKRLIDNEYATMITEGDLRKGITQEDLDQIQEAENQKAKAKKKAKPKIIVPEKYRDQQE